MNINRTSTPSQVVELFASAAAKAKQDGRVSTSELSKLVKNVSNTPEKLSAIEYKAVMGHAMNMLDVLAGQHSKVDDKKTSMIDTALQLARPKTTDQKTVHMSDVKALSTAFNNINTRANETREQLADHRGWNRPKNDVHVGFNSQLNTLSKSISDAKTQIENSSYKHNAGKMDSLRTLESKVTNLRSQLNSEFLKSDKKAAENDRINRDTAHSQETSAQRKEELRDVFNLYLEGKAENPFDSGGFVH